MTFVFQCHNPHKTLNMQKGDVIAVGNVLKSFVLTLAKFVTLRLSYKIRWL